METTDVVDLSYWLRSLTQDKTSLVHIKKKKILRVIELNFIGELIPVMVGNIIAGLLTKPL